VIYNINVALNVLSHVIYSMFPIIFLILTISFLFLSFAKLNKTKIDRPDLTTKKRRGGKRMRRLKEQFEQTEMMKLANRRCFSVETGEYGDDAMGLTLGMLERSKDGGVGSSGSEALRHSYVRAKAGVEKRKMRQANTKASRKRALEYGSSGGQTNGLASSMVFTPVQGMELVNPDAMKDKVREVNRKWFEENAGFQSALPKSK